MCARMAAAFDADEAQRVFKIDQIFRDFQARYNVAPSQEIPVIVAGSRIFDLYKWGLLPKWAKDEKMATNLINARAETLLEKPSFKEAFINFRCAIITSGFYEWNKEKTPFMFTLKENKLFLLAGIASIWKNNKTNKSTSTCCIITCEPNSLTKQVHNRMPVILDEKDLDEWLNPLNKDPNNLMKFLNPYPAEKMAKQMVSKLVNNPRNDDPNIFYTNKTNDSKLSDF